MLSVTQGSADVGFSSVMNMRVLLGRLAPFTVAVGRTVCLLWILNGLASSDWARKLRSRPPYMYTRNLAAPLSVSQIFLTSFFAPSFAKRGPLEGHRTPKSKKKVFQACVRWIYTSPLLLQIGAHLKLKHCGLRNA